MAHIAVYLQRTPSGLHPASAVALCWARDIANERGASITAVALGDAGAWDEALARAAARFGADVLLFGGNDALRSIDVRLKPVHVFVPWTAEGLRVGEDLPHLGQPVPRWLTKQHPPWHGGDAMTGVVAGTFPWHDIAGVLEGDYEQDVERAPLPDFVQAPAASPFAFAAPGPMLAHAPASGLSPKITTALDRLGITLATEAPLPEQGTVFAFGACPESWAHRSPHCRSVLLPGVGGLDRAPDSSWQHADWVLPGELSDVLERLEAPPWRPAQT